MTAQSLRLASQIKAARETLRLSQSEAAEAWGIPLQRLKSWEQGRRAPRPETLDRLWDIWFPPTRPSK
ncbi:MAG: helix-turn-helix domain-containing protein [Deltaproteobacteria bacterium]|nr:helix-turn-helix domain-containing protein [Deltaproteobacteria bacterium]